MHFITFSYGLWLVEGTQHEITYGTNKNLRRMVFNTKVKSDIFEESGESVLKNWVRLCSAMYWTILLEKIC